DTLTLRTLSFESDFSSGRVTRVLGLEGAPAFSFHTAAAVIDDDSGLFVSDDDGLERVVFASGAVTAVAPHADVQSASFVAAVDGGASALVVDDDNRVHEVGAVTREIAVVSGHAVGLAVVGGDVYVGAADGFTRIAIDDPSDQTELHFSELTHGIGNGIALDASGQRAFLTTSTHVVAVSARVDGAFTHAGVLHEGDAAVAVQNLVDVPSTLIPSRGALERECTRGGVAVKNGDVLVADRCTGAVISLALSLP
ncbi:MAG TPA: hypothetical protein VGO62_20385, partial [Myxococcota bacterium]